MLVLGRKLNEQIACRTTDGQVITIEVVRLRAGEVRLGISAPTSVAIWRPDATATGGGRGKDGRDAAA